MTRKTPRRTRPIALLGLTLLAGTGLGGCVSTGAYDNTANTAKALEARNIELIQERDALERALAQRDASDAELRGENARLRTERNELSADIEALNQRVADATIAMQDIRLGGLDPAVDQALRSLARQNPELMSYDSETGRIRFSSDLTFPSGSDTVRDAAKQSLSSLARILSTSGANYLVYIEGHTDSQVPSNPNTLRNHPTNRHLSAHRAIAVGNLLQEQGVSAGRVFTGGWGASRPLVANNANGNTPQNRRVEIYLIADTGERGAPAPAGAPASQPAAAAQPERDERGFPMK